MDPFVLNKARTCSRIVVVVLQNARTILVAVPSGGHVNKSQNSTSVDMDEFLITFSYLETKPRLQVIAIP